MHKKMSDDIERARNQLDGKLSSMGYVHPEVAKPKTNHVYATINVKDDNAQYTSSSKKANPYGTFNAEYDESTVHKNMTCPECQGKALYACDCVEYGDMMCSNNHTWWVDKKGIVHMEDPHDD